VKWPVRWLKWTAIGLGGLIVLVVGLIAWVLNTEAGARSAASLAQKALAEKLEIATIDGTLAGPLTVANLRYRDPGAGIDVRVQHIELDAALRDLFGMLAHVRSLELRGIDIVLSEPTDPPEPKKPFSLKPPIDIAVDSLAVSDARVRKDEAVLVEIVRAAFAGRWTQQDLNVERLDVQASQGEVQFAGRVGQQQTYSGAGKGRFRWTVGERTYAGRIATEAKDDDAQLTLDLTAPVRAQVKAMVEQRESWPWRFAVEVPRFDPREELLPGSSLYGLAASLSGAGSLDAGNISGKVLVNDEPVEIERLQFTRDSQGLTAGSVLRIAKTRGEFRLQGRVELERQPWTANFAANWRDVVVPSAWAGQELHTGGKLDFKGNPQAYSANGALSLGPPQRVADIALAVEGSPDAVELKQFDIVQKKGRLAATGRVELKPAIAWDVNANARDFDPGAFAASWRGRMRFELASQGRMTDEGPDAKVRLANLSGELRGRTLSGAADLAVTPQLVPSGTMELSSGKSELRFRGQPGDQIDATLSLSVASLNDWVPDSGGELKAEFVVRGRWPDLSITGDARGSDLNAMNVRVEQLALDADIKDPRDPQGALNLNLTKLTAAGFEFATVRARASGGGTAHQLQLRVDGEPLAMELDLDGARKEQSWSGTLKNLVFDVKDAARLALREPVKIKVEKDTVEVSNACLRDGDIELCAGGNMQPDGALQASYSLANVPLSLANVLATADMPIKLDGAIQGRGDIRRSPQGEMFGNVLIESPSGRISRHVAVVAGDESAEPPQTLLSYRDLRLAASLSGPDARGSLRAQFDPNGSLEGEATLRGLDQPETPVEATLNGLIPDLAPLAVFAPQLANVHGRAEARIGVSGTLQAPELSGIVSATDFAADIPAVGLRLKNGRFEARPDRSGEISLAGGIDSGDGRLEIAGVASPSGSVHLNIDGKRVLATDIPGARVFITPDLEFVRNTERMMLTGNVTIPEANVDLQKLPRGGEKAQGASSDVVVIDAVTREEEVEKIPLFAELTVTIGEKVELIGFGLQARVEGRLDVREQPGQQTLASGEVRVAGRYKAYGQDLTIERGQLLYAWSPIDNPRLNIEATRKVDEVVAGLRVRGSAQNPELTVYSDPPMGQSNALSYLVAGKPLEDIGSNDSDADAMQTATRSLGAAAGGLLAKNLGRRLGVDELAVKDDEMIGGAALTVGQYLSPRLYLSYGIGLFEPGDVITLRYKLSEEFAVQTQRGPEDTRAGIEYRIEK
jgi:translocation and assembly module TamB